MLKFFLTYLGLAGTLFAQAPTSLMQEFRDQKGVLRHTMVVRTDSSSTTVTQDFLLINDRADTVRGRMRMPRAAEFDSGELARQRQASRFPAAFLVVGVETGKEVVQMIEGHDSVIVVALDYPFVGPYDFSGWNAVRTVFELRETGFKTVPQILLCLDWLFQHPMVDTLDVALIAVSFGVFTAVPAAVIDTRVKRLAIVQAGGDLTEVVAASSERLGAPVPSWLAGWLGGWILTPFEPNRYIGDFAPRPVLIVSGESDLFFPHTSVQSLYDHANEPKEWIRHKSGHVMPGERELILELTKIVAARLYGSR